MKTLDLGKSSTRKIFWTYVIPSIFSIIFTTTAQFIDSAFIGRYVGGDGLASITMLAPFLILLNGVSIMIAIGGVTYAGISKGRNEIQKSNNFFNLTFMMILVAGIVSTLLFLGMNHFFHLLFDVDGNTLELIKTYGLWISLFFIFNMSNLFFNLFLNLDKKPIVVVIVSSLATILNIVLNYLFIVVLNMGIKGAAIASGISQTIPSIIFIYIIMKHSSWKFKFPTIRFNDIKQVLFNGSSELISISSFSISAVVLNGVILNTVGINGVAGFSIALQLGNLVMSFGFGVSDAIQSPLSFNYGANKYGRVKSILFQSIRLNLVFGVMMAIVNLMYGHQFASLFIEDQETIAIAVHILKYYSFGFILIGCNVVISTYYTSVDSPVISGIISVLKSLVYLIIWLLILPEIFGSDGIWLALVFAEVSTSITAIFIYLRAPYGKNQKNKLVLENAN